MKIRATRVISLQQWQKATSALSSDNSVTIEEGLLQRATKVAARGGIRIKSRNSYTSQRAAL